MFSSLVSMLLMSGARPDSRSILAGQTELPSARRAAEHRQVLLDMGRERKTSNGTGTRLPGMLDRLRSGSRVL